MKAEEMIIFTDDLVITLPTQATNTKFLELKKQIEYNRNFKKSVTFLYIIYIQLKDNEDVMKDYT